MAFIGGEELKSLLLKNDVITDSSGFNIFDSKNIKQAAYELSLGSEAFRTDNNEKKAEVLDEKNRYIDINPGQFSLLMTDEFVNIPEDKLAFISIKAKQKLKGLINVSGFHVDPGFKGRLLFSVYNAGPSVITLETKRAYFLIWFSDLKDKLDTEHLYNAKNNHHQGQSSIDPEYISALKKDEMTSPNVLLKKIKDLDTSFGNKIEEKNRKLINNEYLLKLLIGLSIALILRLLFMDFSGNGYKERLDEVQKEIKSIKKENDILKENFNNLKKNDLSLHKDKKYLELNNTNGK